MSQYYLQEAFALVPLQPGVIKAGILMQGLYNLESKSIARVHHRYCIRQALGNEDQHTLRGLASPALHLGAVLPPLQIVSGTTAPYIAQALDLKNSAKSNPASTQLYFNQQQSPQECVDYFSSFSYENVLAFNNAKGKQ